jgi:hypothetical protein
MTKSNTSTKLVLVSDEGVTPAVAAKPAKKPIAAPAKPVRKPVSKAAKAKAAKARAAKAAKAKRIVKMTPAEVRAIWEAPRANAIVKLMRSDDLPYWRAVRRSRRYFFEGKWA